MDKEHLSELLEGFQSVRLRLLFRPITVSFYGSLTAERSSPAPAHTQ
jgi:hypothetical protein